MAFTLTCILVMALIVALTVREVALFLRARDVYPLRRLTLRLCTTVLLLFLLASVWIGVQHFHLHEPRGVVGLWLGFWGCIALLAGAVICLAIADLRLLGDDLGRDTALHRIWRDIAELIAEHEQQQRASQPPDDRPPPGA